MNNDDLNSSDIKRMISAIENDFMVEINQIMKETEQVYEDMKNKTIEKIRTELQNEYKLKAEEIEKERVILESRLKNEYYKKYAQAKSDKIQMILAQVKIKLKSMKLSKGVFLNTVEKLKEDDEDCTVFVNEADLNNVKKHWTGEIMCLPDCCIGGIVISKNDGSIICDSSYKTRLEMFLKQNLKAFKNKLFS